ncbi:unnamed protein product [Cylicocyclus nassatus]|uniref:Uncharacterized protein n=1 Tax=Cylicocyclus nassatus TaxID=53992 RepID=A0AA36DIT3_CYLNA|nr:unnamed protein product [Cylicocyclus nassatus]
MEETDMPPAKRRCSPIPPRAPRPHPVKTDNTTTPAAAPVVKEDANADPEVDFIVRAVRAALQEKNKKSKENINPLVDDIFSLDWYSLLDLHQEQ